LSGESGVNSFSHPTIEFLISCRSSSDGTSGAKAVILEERSCPAARDLPNAPRAATRLGRYAKLRAVDLSTGARFGAGGQRQGRSRATLFLAFSKARDRGARVRRDRRNASGVVPTPSWRRPSMAHQCVDGRAE